MKRIFSNLMLLYFTVFIIGMGVGVENLKFSKTEYKQSIEDADEESEKSEESKEKETKEDTTLERILIYNRIVIKNLENNQDKMIFHNSENYYSHIISLTPPPPEA